MTTAIASEKQFAFARSLFEALAAHKGNPAVEAALTQFRNELVAMLNGTMNKVQAKVLIDALIKLRDSIKAGQVAGAVAVEEPMTPAQRSFVESLLADKDTSNIVVPDLDTLGRKSCSALIDQLKAQPRKVVAPKTAPTSDVKDGDILRAESGDLLLIVRAVSTGNLYTKISAWPTTPGAKIKWTYFPAGKAMIPTSRTLTDEEKAHLDPSAAAPAVTQALGDVEDGRYAWASVSGTNDFTFVRVATSKDGVRSARLVVGGKGVVPTAAPIQVSLAKHLAAMAAPERFQATIDFGRLGACGFCGRSLSNRPSRYAGYGDTCAGKHGLPWGDVPEDWTDPGFEAEVAVMSCRQWNPEDRQAFKDGARLRASTVPSRRSDGPSTDEWTEDDDDTQP